MHIQVVFGHIVVLNAHATCPSVNESKSESPSSAHCRNQSANSQKSDNIWVLECPAKLVWRLVWHLSRDSIGVSFSSSLFPTVATDPVPTSSMHLQCIEHSLSILLATHDVLYCTNYIHNIQGVHNIMVSKLCG